MFSFFLSLTFKAWMELTLWGVPVAPPQRKVCGPGCQIHSQPCNKISIHLIHGEECAKDILREKKITWFPSVEHIRWSPRHPLGCKLLSSHAKRLPYWNVFVKYQQTLNWIASKKQRISAWSTQFNLQHYHYSNIWESTQSFGFLKPSWDTSGKYQSKDV